MNFIKKMIVAVSVIAAVFCVGTVEAKPQAKSTGEITVSTNTTAVSQNLNVVGEIKMIHLNIDTGDCDVDIIDQSSGAVIYSKDDLSADITLLPRLPYTSDNGTSITEVNAGGTNTLYGAAWAVGLTVQTSDSDTGTNKLIVTVIYDDGKK
jgi:hypothetical protein